MKYALIVLWTLVFFRMGAQEPQVQWLGFEQLEDSLAQTPKKVLVHFYTDWCVYCKKMEQATFKDPEVVSLLSEGYYAVHMDAESRDTIYFDGRMYGNKGWGKKRNPIHEIPLLLASRENRAFSLPATLLLNERFEVMDRFFQYMSPKQLKKTLKDHPEYTK